MGDDPLTADLEQFLAERGRALLRVAILLTGTRESGEDLLQAGLERLLRHWRNIDGSPEAYLRKTLYHLAADGRRRQRAQRKGLSLLHAGDAARTVDITTAVDRRDALVRLLLQLPPRQRAAIVLRYWEQLSEAEAARTLGCSVGTIKSAASRGMARLRELSQAWPGSGFELAEETQHEHRL
jgi:RNA polymerase sigma-70 factor (sigma-E family)